MSLQVLDQGFQNEWSTDSVLSLWEHNHCKSLWLTPFQAEKRNAAMLSSHQENLPHLGGYWLTQTWEFLVFSDLVWQRGNELLCAWLSLCMKHFCRWCSRCVKLDETSVLNQGGHAQDCRAAFLTQEATDSLGSCGSEQNALRWKHQLLCPRDEEHGSWLCAAGYKGSLSHHVHTGYEMSLYLNNWAGGCSHMAIAVGSFPSVPPLLPSAEKFLIVQNLLEHWILQFSQLLVLYGRISSWNL